MKTIAIPDDLAQLLGPEERLTEALAEAVVLELFREHRISAGRAAELMGLSYRKFIQLIQTKNVPMLTTPPRNPQRLGKVLHREDEKEKDPRYASTNTTIR